MLTVRHTDCSTARSLLIVCLIFAALLAAQTCGYGLAQLPLPSIASCIRDVLDDFFIAMVAANIAAARPFAWRWIAAAATMTLVVHGVADMGGAAWAGLITRLPGVLVCAVAIFVASSTTRPQH
jgi:hypothetical protein